MPIKPLSADDLYHRCSPKSLRFKTTARLSDLEHPLGQDRAVEAIRFGVNMTSFGYNLFCMGRQGVGKVSLLRRFLNKTAENRPTPQDWCYVNNFNETHKPVALKMPAGRAPEFRQDMDSLIEELQVVLPATFEGEEYKNRRQMIEAKYREAREAFVSELQKRAVGKNVALLRMPAGMVVAPMRDGEVLGPEDFENLPEDEKKELTQELSDAEEDLGEAVQEAPKWERDQREQIRKLNDEVTNYAVQHLIDDLKKKYRDVPDVVAYLSAVREDIVENVDDFLEDEDEEGGNPLAALLQPARQPGEDFFRRYKVNVIISHEKKAGAPVEFLDHPSQANLIGRIERLQHMGALITDFNLIKAGALHRANGGFLVIEARKLLMQPNAWESLKRALRSKKIRMDSNDGDSGIFSTITVDPQPIPLNVKVVLVGDASLYYMLSAADPDFVELFKVEADFAYEMERTPKTERRYARSLAMLTRKEDLRSLNKNAVARVIEQASRVAGDARKLTCHMASIADLVRESDHWARHHNSNTIGQNHVEQALEAQLYRSSRLRERMLEEMERDLILIDTDGEKTGQANALVVYDLGRFSFGRPSRVSCQVRMGKGELIDIERETELGGPIHSKGVMILSGFLASRFAQNFPLSLEASLVFEQSYGGVEGDSASSTELYALLSALSDTPLNQGFGITGSVNQFGEIQPIGGVNEKIEGFFDLCKRRGMTGNQGVLIPTGNRRNLMLRSDILRAVRAGKFSIYAVSTIDEGIEILTGLPAGERDENGVFPRGTINRRVENRLKDFFQKVLSYQQPEGRPLKRTGR